MLRSSQTQLGVKSHQLNHTRIPLSYSGYGRNYNRNTIRFAFKGWGMGTYHPPKDRRFVTSHFHRPRTQDEVDDHSRPISKTTKTLSPHFRPFALADGGVLFIHPSSKEILTWTHEVLGKEQAASKLGNVHDETRAKVQGLIADNTIEHVSLAQWRQMHIQRLMRKSLQRREYSDDHTYRCDETEERPEQTGNHRDRSTIPA